MNYTLNIQVEMKYNIEMKCIQGEMKYNMINKTSACFYTHSKYMAFLPAGLPLAKITRFFNTKE